MKLRPLLVSLLGTWATALPAGPGCAEDAATCADYVPPASFDPQTPVVSFAKDVMPIFGASCAFTSCHGSNSGSANGVYLGGTNAETVFAGIVGVRSDRMPAMAFVKPGAPHESFLLRKVDASQCLLDAQCKDGSCGDSMPRNGGTLPVETRDILRRWIAQGAKDD